MSPTPLKMTARKLRQLLLSRQADDASTLDRWERNTPEGERADLYAAVAKGADALPFPAFFFFAIFLTQVIVHGGLRLAEGGLRSFLASVVSWVAVFFTAALPFFLWARRREKAGRIAAQWLAERVDARCLRPMATFWNPWAQNVSALIEQGFASVPTPMSGATDGEREALIGMLRRAYPDTLRQETRDFRDSAADVLLSTLRRLSVPPRDDAWKTFRRIAYFPAPADAPNRRMVRDVALALLGEGKPVIASKRPLSASATREAGTESKEEMQVIALNRRF